MGNYIGDFPDNAIVPLGAFTTNASDGTRTSFSAGLEEADITIFSSDGDGTWTAMTLDASTIIIEANPGSKVGVYLVAVNMGNDADFTTGKDYVAVLYPDSETVDSKAPAGVIAHWSCENRVADVKRWNGTAVATPATAGYPVVTHKVGTGTGEINLSSGKVPATVAAGDLANDSITAAVIAADAIGSSELAASAANKVRDTILSDSTAFAGANVAAIVADTNELQTDWANGGRLDNILDAAASPALNRTTIATLASQTSFTLTAGSADNDAYNDCTIVIQDASTAAQKAIGIVKDYTGSTKTVTLLADPGIFTMAANDIVTILAPDFLTRYIAAACTAVLSGAGTGTETVKGVDGSTTRLTVTADSSGNRTAVTYG